LSLLAALAYRDAREAALRGAELLKKGLDTDERPVMRHRQPEELRNRWRQPKKYPNDGKTESRQT
jgi:hypothetical protein